MNRGHRSGIADATVGTGVIPVLTPQTKSQIIDMRHVNAGIQRTNTIGRG